MRVKPRKTSSLLCPRVMFSNKFILWQKLNISWAATLVCLTLKALWNASNKYLTRESYKPGKSFFSKNNVRVVLKVHFSQLCNDWNIPEFQWRKGLHRRFAFGCDRYVIKSVGFLAVFLRFYGRLFCWGKSVPISLKIIPDIIGIWTTLFAGGRIHYKSSAILRLENNQERGAHKVRSCQFGERKSTLESVFDGHQEKRSRLREVGNVHSDWFRLAQLDPSQSNLGLDLQTSLGFFAEQPSSILLTVRPRVLEFGHEIEHHAKSIASWSWKLVVVPASAHFDRRCDRATW